MSCFHKLSPWYSQFDQVLNNRPDLSISKEIVISLWKGINNPDDPVSIMKKEIGVRGLPDRRRNMLLSAEVCHHEIGAGCDILICFCVDSADGDFWWELQTRYLETKRGG